MPNMLKMPKMPNNKIDKNKGVYIANKGLERTFLQAIVL